ncbi:hypothetical protein [Halovivax limisalsi]|uniref:hypothetical protein n=1 Tax=Halovivax limisalsi TaxID=1453760 RepID=UPI001FFD55E5|nr:hypothetical protein [Halovivax limisalsi]
MSATHRSTIAETIDGCRPIETTPIDVDASSLESTDTAYLRDFKRTLREEGFTPARLTVEAGFDGTCSLETQATADRVREYIRVGSFLGIDSLLVECRTEGDGERIRSALRACADRADRAGIRLDVSGDVDLTS